MKTVEVGNNVTVHYVGTLEDGTEFDNSHKRGAPIDFEVGAGRMIKGFDHAVAGMTEGQTKSITVSAEDAYGARNPEATQTVPKTAFGEDFEFEVGGVIQGNGPYGPFVATIDTINESDVTLDMNHPLAGKDLNFSIEMVQITQ